VIRTGFVDWSLLLYVVVIDKDFAEGRGTMEVVLESDTGEYETSTWAFVKEGSRVEFGAQVVPQNHPTELVVAWGAAAATEGLRSIVGYTRKALGNHSKSFGGRLRGYGRVFGSRPLYRGR
jgi:hypothetical protein